MIEEVIKQEEKYIFNEFNNKDAYTLGNLIIKKVEDTKLKNVRIRIVIDNDIVFQYIMDGKKGEEWLNRKQNTVEKYQHSSYYVYLQQDKIKDLDVNDPKLAICGGGFPLVINNTIRGCIIVSGLAHDEDHQLIIDCLKEIKDESICE